MDEMNIQILIFKFQDSDGDPTSWVHVPNNNDVAAATGFVADAAHINDTTEAAHDQTSMEGDGGGMIYSIFLHYHSSSILNL